MSFNRIFFRNLLWAQMTTTMTIPVETFKLVFNPSESDLFRITSKSFSKLFKSNPKNVLNLGGWKSDNNKSDSMLFNLFQFDSRRLNLVQYGSIQNLNPNKSESFQPRIHWESFGLNRLSDWFSNDLDRKRSNRFFRVVRNDSTRY